MEFNRSKRPAPIQRGIRGFTLIELMIIVVIIGILSAVAVPKYMDSVDRAKASSEESAVASVRTGIAIQFAETLAIDGRGTYPSVLDSASNDFASIQNPLFGDVLDEGIIKGWRKRGRNTYEGPTTTRYRYYPRSGEFNVLD